MKNYKALAPIVMVVLFASSVYMVFDSNRKADQLYNEYLQAARSFAEQGIIVDALAYYQLALNVNETYELCIEMLDFFLESEQKNESVNWCMRLIKDYPENLEPYNCLMDIYEGNNDYLACFRLADDMQNAGLPTDSIADTLSRIHYTYFLYGAYENVTAFGGGYCAVEKKGKWGFVNEPGVPVTGIVFDSVGTFRQDLAPVVDHEKAAYYIDTAGNKKKVILGVEYIKELGTREEGVLTLFDGTEWALYRQDSELVVGGFEDASSYSNGIVAVKKDGKWTLLNGDGQQTSSSEYDDVLQDELGVVFRYDRLFVKENDAYYMIDSTGKKITDRSFEDARLFIDPNNPYAAVKFDGKWGFIDTSGNVFLEPQYEDARSFSNGHAAVKLDGKWGFIDAEKQLVLECTFLDARDFNSRGCVFVFVDGAWQLLKLYRFNH